MNEIFDAFDGVYSGGWCGGECINSHNKNLGKGNLACLSSHELN